MTLKGELIQSNRHERTQKNKPDNSGVKIKKNTYFVTESILIFHFQGREINQLNILGSTRTTALTEFIIPLEKL